MNALGFRDTMATWDEFESGTPELAERAREVLERTGVGEGLLTTVAGDALPRAHPVNVGIVDGRLLTFAQAGSAKAKDLAADGRYALHAHVDPAAPHELLLRGRAASVTDPEARARATQDWAFEVDDSYDLYALDLEHVLLGARDSADEWPPRYSSWRPFIGAAARRP